MISRKSIVDRRPIALALAAAALAAGVAGCSLGGSDDDSEAEAGSTGKPNVIVVLTDDMTLADLYETYEDDGEGEQLMPHTRELIGGDGVTFDRYYSSNSISCPSRYTNLNGQYSKNHGVTRNNWGVPGEEPPPDSYCSHPSRVDLDRTLPVWLQQAGYRTMHYGRFLNAFNIQDKERVPPGWDEYVQPVETDISSAAAFYGYRLNINGELGEVLGDEENPTDEGYFSDVIVDMALEEIAEGDRSKPFYVAIDHRAPHEDTPPPVGPQPALRHQGALDGKDQRRPPNYDEADVSDKAKWLRQSRRLNERQDGIIQERNQHRLESLLAVDEGVEKIVEELEELGDLDDTYIMFTSDNGFFNGEHRVSSGKFRPFENSSHVPFMIRGPGIPAGEASEELAMNVDIAPTIVEISGAKPDLEMDGRSLLPFARHPERLTRRPILIEAYPPKKDPDGPKGPGGIPAGDPAPPTWFGIVYGRWKLVRYKGQGYELYDLERDPYEVLSVANSSPHRDVFEFLRAELERLEDCKGAACRRQVPEAPPKPPGGA